MPGKPLWFQKCTGLKDVIALSIVNPLHGDVFLVLLTMHDCACVCQAWVT